MGTERAVVRIDDYVHATIRARKLPLEAQAVLWAIAFYVNWRSGETFVSVKTIAEDVHLSTGQTRRWMRELEQVGVFTVAATPRANIYRFPVHPALSTPHRSTGGVLHRRTGGVPHRYSPATPPVQPSDPTGTPAHNSSNSEETLRARPRPELVETGLYGDEHWNVS